MSEESPLASTISRSSVKIDYMGNPSRYHALLFMLLCLLSAAALRLPDLDAVPPGLHYDEAANGTLAAEIGQQGKRPVFISSYTGKEPLFFYLAGGMMAWLGDSVFSLRLTAAFVGLLTVATTYSAGRMLFKERRIALVAAALITVSFWHLLFSRLGFRAITQPWLQSMTILALYRGLRRHHYGWLAAAGAFLGLTAYTYLAARLFPVVLMLAIVPLLLNRTNYRQRWKQLALVCLVALAIVTPLLIYFLNRPEAFWVRINQVNGDAIEATPDLARSYLKSLQMFFLLGDPYWRFNIPERPLFGRFWGGLLLLGWAVTLWRWLRSKIDWQQSASLLIVLAPLVMILPTALAIGEITPSNLRAIGLIPFIYYLPAAGLHRIWQEGERRFHSLLTFIPESTLAVGLLILIAGGLIARQAYFVDWAREPSLYFESDGDLADVAHYLDGLDTSGATVYLAALHYRHPTLAFLSQRYDEIKWLPGSEAIVFPATGPAIYIFPRSSPRPSWVTPFLESAVSLPSVNGPDGRPSFLAYRLAQSPTLAAPNGVDVNFANAITLLGYEIEDAAAGSTLPVTLYWQVNSPPATDFVPFVHLQDAWQYRWSQLEKDAYPADQWQPGETIIQRLDLPLPAGMPPGVYRLRLGLFAPDTGERLAHLDEAGRYAGDSFVIEQVPIVVGRMPDILPQPPFVIDEPARPGLRLLGYERGGDSIATGENYQLALWWQATSKQPSLSTRLEMMRADNTGHILINTQPVHGTYPFSNWPAPQFVIDRVDPKIPSNFPPGEYRLLLRFLDGNDDTLLTADLGPLLVEATERLYTPPRVAHPMAATFGNEIALRGYEIKQPEEAGRYELTLVWQAISQPSANYTVFVHILQADGSCSPCIWQQDSMPQGGQFPTGRWLANEVVVDRYQIALPEEMAAGQYAIEVGLYVADTGQRLLASQPNMKPSDTINLHELPWGR